MHPSLKPLVEIVFFNNALFNAAVGDVSEADAIIRHSNADTAGANSSANTYKWILGHVVTGRYVLGNLCAIKDEFPWNGIFMADTLDKPLPTLVEIAKEFDRITPRLVRSLAMLDEKKLLTAPSSPFPTAEKTTLAAIAFLLQHESYHIGQASYVRRLLGKTGLVDKLLSS